VRAIRVPTQYRAGFTYLANLDEEAFTRLKEAVHDPAISLMRLPVLTARIEAATGANPDDAEVLARALLSIGSGRAVHNDSIEDFASAIAASVDLDMNDEARSLVKERIAQLSATPALALASKTAYIGTEFDRVFHSARVLTDIRPVFGDEATEPPAGAVVIHTLKIDAFRTGELDDYYVTLSSTDLMVVMEVILRAVDKAKSLDEYLASVGFEQFHLEGDDE
jgi:hypothetical protein